MHGTTRRGTLQITPGTCREERLTSFSWTIEKAYSDVFSEGVESFKLLKRELREGRVPDEFGAHVWNVISDLDDVIEEGWSRLGSEAGEPLRETYRFFSRTEQEPNPDSRVTLGDELDALGQPRAHLHWSLSETDLRSTRRSQEIVGEELARAGLGRMRLLGEDDWARFLYGGWHHMGTTRMSDDPKRGVVDRDGKVHGIANLYVAGSSVFSTSGWSNPTLSIVALALRLAQHVRGKL
jgi:choline dehydrogenase-like flavoprotein